MLSTNYPEGVENEIFSLVYNPQNNTILCGSNNGLINAWKIHTWEYVCCFSGHKAAVVTMVLDGKILFSGSEDTTIKVWETVKNYLMFSLEGNGATVRSLIILRPEGYLLSCSEKKIRVWDYKN